VSAPDAQPALAMLDAFASVGARRFDLTLTDVAGTKVGFRGNRSLDQLRPAIPGILEDAARRQHNVIVRPRSAGATLIQLDDLGQDAAARLASVSFLLLRTSPGSYQAWIAVPDGDADFARRLRLGAGADPCASGASRVCGSFNVKELYAPAFPRVETVQANPGKVVTRTDLEALGVVAPLERPAPAAGQVPRRGTAAKAWPSYQRCVEKAPPVRDGGRPDRSRADYTFCLMAIDWGRSVEETAARLMQESSKAQENGEAYALRTAQKAAAAIAGRGGQPELTASLPRAIDGPPQPGEAGMAKRRGKAARQTDDAKKSGPPPIPRQWAQAGIKRGSELAPPRPRRLEQGGGRQWTGTLPASEDVIAIGEGRYAHFRRSRRYDQVQVLFTAPEGVDPDPGPELTEEFKVLGWKRRPRDPGQPWTYQLDKPTREDPTARGDSRDALHDQFLAIILDYRDKRGLPPLEGAIGWSR
jgi:hypothetical protein